MIRKILILCALAVGTLCKIIAAPALGIFPPVSVLQDELAMHPGDALPRLIPYAGRIFHPHYVGARALGNGRYAVIVDLAAQ